MANQATTPKGKPTVAPNTSQNESFPKSLAIKLYNWSTTSQPSADPITIVCISDTQNSKPDIPTGDVLLHAGNLSQYGTFEEVQAALNWLNTLPHAHKIVIAGRRDFILDDVFVEQHREWDIKTWEQSRLELDWGNITYLFDERHDVAVRGRTLVLFGSPHTPESGDYAFQYKGYENFWFWRVPSDAAVLFVHGPPGRTSEDLLGCPWLLDEVKRVKPQLVVCGNMQGARREDVLKMGKVEELYAEIMASDGKGNSLTLLKLLLESVKMKFGKSKDPSGTTRIVNASVRREVRGKDTLEATVVEV